MLVMFIKFHNCLLLLLSLLIEVMSQLNDTDEYLDLAYNPSGNNFGWPSEEEREDFIKRGRYDARDVIPTRVQFFQEQAYFVFPRFRPGVPFTLGYMDVTAKDKCNPKIYPYPSLDLHKDENCDAIRNSVDLYLDVKNILWVLDVGIVNTLEACKVIGSPKAVGIDVTTGKIIHSINLNPLICSKSRLQFIISEVVDDRTFLYVSDAGTNSVITYDVRNGRGFRVLLPKDVIEGGRKDCLYLLMAHKTCGVNYLFFTYLGSSKMYSVKTCNFRLGLTKGSIVLIGEKPAKMVFLGTDNGQNLFFRYAGSNIIYLWNTQHNFYKANFVEVERPMYCRMATHVTVGYRRLMWVLESNFQDYISASVGCLGANSRLHPILKSCSEVELR